MKLKLISLSNRIRLTIKSMTRLDLYFLFIFIIALCVHLYLSLIGWNNTIFDLHGFRQSQTAISAYYVIKEGFKLNYITPVLGAPWSIPMEFPIYQWIVAAIVLVLKTPLDQTGRFISLFSFYLSLFPIYSLLGYFIKSKFNRLLILTLIILNPIYIFWPRTFMIESTTLLFCLLFLWGFAKSLETKKIPFIIFTTFIGSCAGLSKITTLIIFLFPALIIFLWLWYKKELNRFAPRVLIRYFLYGLIMVIIPFLISIAWVKYADYQKGLNPLSSIFLISKQMTGWNFGTIQQRLSLNTWNMVLSHATIGEFSFGKTETLGKIALFMLLLLLGLSIILNRRRRTEIIVLMLFFFFAPLVFTNLFLVHTYYSYASALFLSTAVGFSLLSYLEINKHRLTLFIGLILLPILIICSLGSYYKSYYLAQKTNNQIFQPIIQAIRKNVPKDKVMIIYGFGWDSSLPYASERKSIMDMWELPLTDDRIQSSIANLENSKIGGMVISGERTAEFINSRVNILKLNPIPVYNSGGVTLYIP